MTEKTQEQAPATPEKKSTQVVINSGDIDAIVADARGEKPKALDDQPPPAEPKVEAKANGHDDEEEGEDGLTKSQREDPALTEKMKRAIGKQFRKRKEAEEFAESQFNEKQLALRENERLSREAQRLKEQLTPKPVVEAPKEPDRANFKTDKEYADAMIDYRVDQKLRAKEAADHQKAIEDRQREIQAQAIERITVAKERVPDYDEVVGSVDLPVPPDVAGYMQESELFAELGYYLAKNPQELEKLGKMTPAKQLVAIGKIEAILKPFGESVSPKVEPQTGAKPESQDGKATKPTPSTDGQKPSKARVMPITPLETTSAAQVEKPASDRTYDEEKALWARQHKVNFKARRRH